MNNEQAIRNAISDSIAKGEIKHVTIAADSSEIQQLISATVASSWDFTDCNPDDEGREVVDVYSVDGSADQWRLYVTFESEPVPAKMDNFKRDRFAELVRSAKTQKQVTRLWNYADHQQNADELFQIITAITPDSFDDPRDANTLRFEY